MTFMVLVQETETGFLASTILTASTEYNCTCKLK